MEMMLRTRGVVLCLGLGMVLVAAKLWLLDQVGTSMPMWDQIDGEGEVILRPWAEGSLKLSNFFHPHNEHRVALSRLYALTLTRINQQWDAFVETVGNAFIDSGFALMLLVFGGRRLRGFWFAFLAVVIAALWAPPVAWENTLYGFQSAFYFLLILGFGQIWLVLGSHRLGLRWGFGQLCGLLALGAMASGLISSLAVIGLVAFDALRKRRADAWTCVTLGVSIVWVVIGWSTRFHVVGHEPLAAHTPGQFTGALAKILSWPAEAWLPYSLFLLTPLVIACWRLLRQQERNGFDRVFLGIAAWVIGMLVAMALMRANEHALSYRYVDTFAILLILECIAIGVYLRGYTRWIIAVAWGFMVGIGIYGHANQAWHSFLVPERRRLVKAEANVRAYLATQDAAYLLNKGSREIPYHSGEVLVERFRHASIQRLMPAVVRAPVPILAAPIPADVMAGLPPSDYPVIAASPIEAQNEAWIWRSERQSGDTLPVLRFRFSGNLGDPNAALTFAVVSDHQRVEVHPDGPAPQRWKTINVIRPAGEWWIELADRDALGSFALTAPVELGWLSWIAEKTIKHHGWLFSAGGMLILIGALLHVPKRRPHQPPAT